MSRFLCLIPARGGSKGIPKKNIKSLAGKPLIAYAIDVARKFSSDEFICVSTDDREIKQVVEEYGLEVPILRPETLANDTAGMYGVIQHALDYYKNNRGQVFDYLVLLQPTSPFRTVEDVREAVNEYEKNSDNLDMVVSVVESDENPYYTLFEENEDGYLAKSKPSNFLTRQECPKVYKYNGAVYVINVASVNKNDSFTAMKRIKKVVMDRYASIDIDEPIDWLFCEMLLSNKIVKI